MMTFKLRYLIVCAFSIVATGLSLGNGCGTTPVQPANLSVTATATPTTAIGTTAVTLAATITGGTAPYTIQWTASPAVAITNDTSANASATVTATITFTATVTDSASPAETASATATVTIGATAALAVTATATPPTEPGAAAVTLAATITGGLPPYTIKWTANPAVAITNDTLANASATVTATTTFTVTVTDSAAPAATVTATATVTITLVGNAANGLTLFNASCVGCHAATVVKPGANLITTTGLGAINPAMNGITLTNQQVADLQAYLATV